MKQQCPVCRCEYHHIVTEAMNICPNQHHLCWNCYDSYFEQPVMTCPQCRAFVHQSDVNFNQNYTSLDQSITQKVNRSQRTVHELNVKMESSISQIAGLRNFKTQKHRFLRQRAVNFMRQNDFDNATLILKIAIENNFSLCEKEKYIGLGSLQEQTGFSEGKGFSWYQKRYGDNLCLYDLLGISCLLKPTYNMEIIIWLKAMIGKTRGKSYKLMYNLALIFDNSGDKHHACDLCKKIIKVKPSFSKTYQMMAFLNKLIGEKEEFASKCLQRDKGNIFAEFILASCQSIPALRVAKLQKIIKKQPTYLRPLFQIGNTNLDERKTQSFLLEFQRCIRQNQAFIEAHIQLGQAKWYLGLDPQAIAVTSAVIQRDDSSSLQRSICYQYLGKYYEQGNLERALQFYTKAYELAPESLQFLIDMLKTHMYLGQFEEVIDVCIQAIQNYNKLSLKYNDSEKGKQWLCQEGINILNNLNNYYILALIKLKRYQEALQLIKSLGRPFYIETYMYYYIQLEDNDYDTLEWLRACLAQNYKTERIYKMIISLLYKFRYYEECLVRIRDYLLEFRLNGRQKIYYCRLAKRIKLQVSRQRTHIEMK